MNLLVETKDGKVEGFCENGLVKFLGIPYAQQPVGMLRWKRARKGNGWDGVLSAKQYGNVAWQDDHDEFQGGDDCLTVNVVRPEEGDNLPVFVWIHGGGYMTGSASDTMYHGDSFAKDGVIYVNFQYRLNVPGFYDFSTYNGCEEIESNRGLSDIVMALRWIHDNITAFGGDTDRITIAGESAGGAAVITLLATPSAKGLFSQAIAESALCNCVMTPRMQRKNVDLFLEGMGWSAADLPEKLFAAHPYDMVKGARYQEKVHQYHYPGIFEPGPVIDDLLPERPLDAIRKGAGAGVKLIIGTNLHEGTMFVRPEDTGFPNSWEMVHEMFENTGHLDAYEAIKAYYDDLAKEEKYGTPFVHFATDYVWEMPSMKAAQAQRKYADTWMYRFEYMSKFARETGMLVTHAFELPCVFGVKDHEFSKVFFEGETQEDADRIIEDMHGAWVNFTKYGEPNPGEWGRYEGDVSPVRIFDHHTRTEMLDRSKMMQVWDDMRFYEE
jgi:para-nitrobenzyl esterase